MRGAMTDAMRGTMYKASPFSNPIDRLYQDNMISRPMAHLGPVTSDRHYELAKRRDLPIQTTNYPLIPAYQPDSRSPSVLINNGIAPLPNAGIYRRNNNIVIGGVVVG